MRVGRVEPAQAGIRQKGIPTVHIEPSLLEILACPKCHAALQPDSAESLLVCTGCGLAYPVRDNIPVLLVDEARRPDDPSTPGGTG